MITHKQLAIDAVELVTPAIERLFDRTNRKELQVWRDGSANINHQTIHPAFLHEEDVLFCESFVYGNIVVACSGVQQWFDMLVSAWIAVAIEQLAMHE